MSSDIIQHAADEFEIELRGANAEQLRQMLAGELTRTAESLRRCALIWQELVNRGQDLSDLRRGLFIYLPLIANGRIDPELVVNHASQQLLLFALSQLPIEAQRRIATRGSIPVMRMLESGVIGEVEVPLGRMSTHDIRIALGDGVIRTPDAQKRLLEQRLTRLASKPARARKAKVSQDGALLIVGATRIPIERVIEALSAHYHLDIAEVLKGALGD